jgi:hypothetical protein
MVPPVGVPQNLKIKVPVDLKLKPGWTYNPSRRLFESDSGQTFVPKGLPKHSKLVYKIPALVGKKAKLSPPEQDLQRYMQAILPAGESPANYVAVVREWPCVAQADVAPEVSLP